MNLAQLERACLEFVSGRLPADAAHDISHVRRVVKNVRYLSDFEGANPLIALPAAWLHDCVQVGKDSDRRHHSSRLAAAAAREFLAGLDYPPELLPGVVHAIEAHSFSAAIAPQTVEARVVQDADRLDSLGAVGIARCLLVGGRLDRPLCDPVDPFCDRREPDDARYTLDHFYAKLLHLPATMQTPAGREEARRRAEFMGAYLDRLREELV
jgi:uncharacterized protein